MKNCAVTGAWSSAIIINPSIFTLLKVSFSKNTLKKDIVDRLCPWWTRSKKILFCWKKSWLLHRNKWSGLFCSNEWVSRLLERVSVYNKIFFIWSLSLFAQYFVVTCKEIGVQIFTFAVSYFPTARVQGYSIYYILWITFLPLLLFLNPLINSFY